jgi:autotransporter adhesin
MGKDTDGIVVDVTGTAGKRKITGVADGDMSNGSSDAVNGSQLYATNQQVAINTNSISNIQSTISNISNGSSGEFQMSRDRSGAMPVSSGTNSAAGGANATASGANSVAVGNDSTASGSNATALGQAAIANGVGSTAVGQGAIASNPNDVALGSGSVTSAAVAVNSATVNGVTYSNFAGSHPIGAVSVGSAGNDRQIQNVAAGQITATSTDAVNGSQLYSVASQMTNMAGQVSGVTNQVDTNTTNVTNLQNGSAGMFQVSGDANSTQPVASGTQSTAGGNGAVASGASSTAVGNSAQATGNNSMAIGAGSVATQANTVSVGSAGNERQIKNVAAGTQATDAVNVSQLQSSQAGTVHYDTNTDGSVDTGSVTLNSGGSSASIHNVSAGTAVTDAVNVGQMNNGLRQVADWSKSYSDTIGHQASAGMASAMAMAGVPVAYAPNQSSVGVGVGSFRGESSLAVGMSTISESGRYVFKASATSDTRGDRGVSLGAGITF